MGENAERERIGVLERGEKLPFFRFPMPTPVEKLIKPTQTRCKMYTYTLILIVVDHGDFTAVGLSYIARPSSSTLIKVPRSERTKERERGEGKRFREQASRSDPTHTHRYTHTHTHKPNSGADTTGLAHEQPNYCYLSR